MSSIPKAKPRPTELRRQWFKGNHRYKATHACRGRFPLTTRLPNNLCAETDQTYSLIEKTLTMRGAHNPFTILLPPYLKLTRVSTPIQRKAYSLC